MRDGHIMDELKENSATAFLLGAFLIGIVTFALVTGGFVSLF
jgi:hypothetical protein